jgi:type II secretory pathway component PulJ
MINMRNRPGFTVVELLVLIGVAAAVAFVCALFYVAVHLIGKVW